MTAMKCGIQKDYVVSLVFWHSLRFVAIQKGTCYDEIIGCNQRIDPNT
jgi:hypothetical protein